MDYLVAFDLTPGAEAALEKATELAEARGASIELVYVWPPPVYVSPLGLVSEQPEATRAEAAVEDRARNLRERGVPARTRFEFGDPAERLTALGRTGRYALLALGTHGRTGLARWALGSVAEQVVRGARCPVLTVRRRDGGTVEKAHSGRVLVAVDFSPASDAALERAVELAGALGAGIDLLHVWEPPPPIEAPGMAPWLFDDSAARDLLERTRRSLEPRGLRGVTVRLESGDPAYHILEAARALLPDLLVLGTHGRGGVRRLILGSVAEAVVRRAPCPTLTVHAPVERAAFALTRAVRGRFDEVLRRLPDVLRAEGFGVLTEIDVQKTLREKLGVERRRYRVLGACSPQLAQRALAARPDAGVLIPCNVAVFEDEEGATQVAAIDPLETPAASDPALREVASEARERLARALERL